MSEFIVNLLIENGSESVFAILKSSGLTIVTLHHSPTPGRERSMMRLRSKGKKATRHKVTHSKENKKAIKKRKSGFAAY